MKTMDRRSFMGTIGKPMAAAAAVAAIEPALMNRALASVRGVKGDPSDISNQNDSSLAISSGRPDVFFTAAMTLPMMAGWIRTAAAAGLATALKN